MCVHVSVTNTTMLSFVVVVEDGVCVGVYVCGGKASTEYLAKRVFEFVLVVFVAFIPKLEFKSM